MTAREEMKRAKVAVYLTCEEGVADELSRLMGLGVKAIEQRDDALVLLREARTALTRVYLQAPTQGKGFTDAKVGLDWEETTTTLKSEIDDLLEKVEEGLGA